MAGTDLAFNLSGIVRLDKCGAPGLEVSPLELWRTGDLVGRGGGEGGRDGDSSIGVGGNCLSLGSPVCDPGCVGTCGL